MSFYIQLSIALAISFLLGSLAPTVSVIALESSLVGVAGAVVGGVIAALAFIFGLLLEVVKRKNITKELFEPLSSSLRTDVTLLIWTLCFSIFLPLIRKIDFPYIHYPDCISIYLINKNQLITSLEIFIVIIAISVLFEICDSMFRILATSTK